MKKFNTVIAAAAVALALFSSSGYAADPVMMHQSPPSPSQSSSSYVKLYGGMTFVQGDSSTFTRSGTSATTGAVTPGPIASFTTNATGSTDFQPKYALGAAFGMNFSKMIAAELEYNYTRVGMDHFSLPNGSVAGFSDYGDNAFLAGHSFFANVYYHVETGASKISPYLGVGVGYLTSAKLELEKTALTSSKTYETDSGELVGQAILGLAFQMDPATSLSLEARYATTFDDQKLSLKNTKAGENDMIDSLKYQPISLMVGVNYAF